MDGQPSQSVSSHPRPLRVLFIRVLFMRVLFLRVVFIRAIFIICASCSSARPLHPRVLLSRAPSLSASACALTAVRTPSISAAISAFFSAAVISSPNRAAPARSRRESR